MNSPSDARPLITLFGLHPGSCVSLVGAGGKTTTMLALARAAATGRFRTVVTTTTKIWPPEDMPVLLAERDAESAVRDELRSHRVVALGSGMTGEAKLGGVRPGVPCELLASGTADVVLCEADGARGRPLKVHGAGEPVVPACSSTLIVVAGLDAVGCIPDEGVVHRREAFLDDFAAEAARPVTPDLVARIMLRGAAHAPSGARVVYLLNKEDGATRLSAARSVYRALREHDPRAVVLFGSLGHVRVGDGGSFAAGVADWTSHRAP